MFSRKISTKNLFLESNAESLLLVTENTDKIWCEEKPGPWKTWTLKRDISSEGF